MTTPFRTLELLDCSIDRQGYPLDFEVEVVDAAATAEHPLSFRVSLRWNGDEPTDVRTGSTDSLAPTFP
ncbi:hypothetical protein [Haloprofundus salilacus]|uniref:hypothetical protein n=1 Tax=Haloprofundus salilacus TaxID=2876190 RepID=UPI001CCCE911|nr:hypothetical protein [Haloprofundus salilacus]